MGLPELQKDIYIKNLMVEKVEDGVLLRQPPAPQPEPVQGESALAGRATVRQSSPQPIGDQFEQVQQQMSNLIGGTVTRGRQLP